MTIKLKQRDFCWANVSETKDVTQQADSLIETSLLHVVNNGAL